MSLRTGLSPSAITLGEIMKLVIDREKWARGANNGKLLFDNNSGKQSGKMCCLGFLALECGFKKKNILNRYEFIELRAHHPKLSKRLPTALQPIESRLGFYPKSDEAHWTETNITDQLMTLNDAVLFYKGKNLTEKMREDKLRRKFKSVGVEVTFIN